MTKLHNPYAAALNRTAVLILTLWLALGGVAALAAASPSCDGVCCRLQSDSVQLRSPLRHCCNSAVPTACNLTESQGSPAQPAIPALSLSDSGLMPLPAFACQHVEDAHSPRSDHNWLTRLQRNQPSRLLYLQHNTFLC